MAPTAAYDEIADWYEEEFLGGQATGARKSDGSPLDLGGLLRDLLGAGDGVCLEIGCGTGVHAAQVRELGWTPLGVDLSAGMLRHARGRLPVAQADAAHLPVPDGTLPAVIAVMVHTDMPAYPAILRGGEAGVTATAGDSRAEKAGVTARAGGERRALQAGAAGYAE